MTALWCLTQELSKLPSIVNDIANIINAVAIIVLAVLTGIYAYHTKKLADFSKKLAKSSEEGTRQAREQSSRMLRPLIVPEIFQIGVDRWEFWRGGITIKNGGNGPAIQPKIQILGENSEIIWNETFSVLLMGEAVESRVNLPLPATVTILAGCKLDYCLEVYWRSAYEIGHAKSVLPFTLNVDSNSDVTLTVGVLNFDWSAVLRVVN